MRVSRLVEAEDDVLNRGSKADYERRFNEAESVDDKWAVVKELLLVEEDIDPKRVQAMESLGSSFMSRWAEAMHFDEMFRQDNEFMTILRNKFGGIDDASFLKSQDNFLKLYNVYANNNLDYQWLTQDSCINYLISLPRTYTFNDNDFDYIFKSYATLKDKGLSDDELLDVYTIKDNGGKVADIRDMADIEQRVTAHTQVGRSKADKEQIKNMIKQALEDDELRNFMKNEINNYQR